MKPPALIDYLLGLLQDHGDKIHQDYSIIIHATITDIKSAAIHIWIIGCSFAEVLAG
jgi:hypothetical protein